jgi:hypothetical protein
MKISELIPKALLLAIISFLGTLVDTSASERLGFSDALDARFPDLTPRERMEVGLMDAVEIATSGEAFSWSHTAAYRGDYQLGMAWIKLVSGQRLQVRVKVGDQVLREMKVEPSSEPVRLETRLPGIEAGDSIRLTVTPETGTYYQMGFHLALATPVFEGLQVFNVSDFGALGDGTNDDFAAVQRAVAAARSAGGGIIRFEAEKTYRVVGRDDMKPEYIFDLVDASNILIEGHGSTLLLHPPDALADIRNARNIQIDGFLVDYLPLPYYQGEIIQIDPDNMTIDLRVPDRYPVPEVGSSDFNGPFFGRSFVPHYPGARSGSGDNIYVERVVRLDNEREVRIHVTHEAMGSDTPNVGMQRRVERAKEAGATEFIVPHVQYGHRNGQTYIHGGGRILLSNLHWYCVPYFWLNIQHNIGPVTLRNVNLQMRQPETELFVSWRDGMHIKNGRFGITIEDCDLDGAAMYDDTFAIYTRVHRILSVENNRLELEPTFRNQKDFETWRKGDWVSIWNTDQTELRGMSRLVSAHNVYRENRFHLVLESPPEGIEWDDKLINEEILNRNTLIRNNRTTTVGAGRATTRFRASNILFENNHFESFYFTVEFAPFWGTPRSRGVYVRDTHFGFGDSRISLQWPMGVHMENVRIHDALLLAGPNAKDVRLKDIRWTEPAHLFMRLHAGSEVWVYGDSQIDGVPIQQDPSILKRGSAVNPDAHLHLASPDGYPPSLESFKD